MAQSVEAFRLRLEEWDYLAETGLATALYVAHSLHKPFFLEGEPGVGKTEVAKVLASILGTSLIRIQCYRGLEANSVLYEWNYLKQMLTLRAGEASGNLRSESAQQFVDTELFAERFLVERPLLAALRSSQAPVVLIDEIDRADEEFEAFLLEFLADFQVTIPELGTVKARQPPHVIITSNRTREVHDALRRRCLYYWIPYPTFQKEFAIVSRRIPEAPRRLAAQLCALMQVLRQRDLVKKPGLAETLDWVRTLMLLRADEVTEATVRVTLGSALKTAEDLALAEAELRTLLVQMETELARSLPGEPLAGDGRC